MLESFNLWIEEDKLIMDLVDMIRDMQMERRAKRKMNSNRWKGDLVLVIKECTRDLNISKMHFIIRQLTSYKVEVKDYNGILEVDIESKECSYRY